jgi:hypothetical protein
VVREEVDYVEAAVEIVRNPSWGRSSVDSRGKMKVDVQVG